MNSPFSNRILREWFIKHFETPDLGIDSVVSLGSGPFEESEFDEFLKRNGIKPFEPSEDVETVVVGIDEWDQLKLLQMLILRKGRRLKVYSQEMLMSYLLTGTDPFESGQAILTEFADSHPALQFLQTMGFDWPSTFIQPSAGSGDIFTDWPKKGLLGWLGYRVGRKGLRANRRLAILSRAFEGDTPIGLPVSYTADYGKPASPQRLKKIANSIAAFCRNAKRRQTHQTDTAISDWENDLEWLRETFYEPMGFRFQWPDTEVS